MGNTFCKVEDSNKNKYILTDKNKQPLQCKLKSEGDIGTCSIYNMKKVLDDPTLIDKNQSDDFLLEDMQIPCKVIRDISLNAIDSEPINKSNINFDNYNIASINKDIVIENKDNKPVTVQDIEFYYDTLYYLDKNNQNDQNDISKLQENKLEYLKRINDYKQKLLIQEDISKANLNVLSSINTDAITDAIADATAVAIQNAIQNATTNINANPNILSTTSINTNTNANTTTSTNTNANTTTSINTNTNANANANTDILSNTNASNNNMYIGISAVVLGVIGVGVILYLNRKKIQTSEKNIP